MDKRLCEKCLYYEGNIVPLNGENNIFEQCSKKYCDSNGIEIEIKYGLPNSMVICATSSNFRYNLNALIGEYKSFKSIQLTKKEFDTFDQWKDNSEIIEKICTRKLGCEKCRDAQYKVNRKDDMYFLETSVKLQADLWKCKLCGTYWEYGIYNSVIVDPTYVKYYYHKS